MANAAKISLAQTPHEMARVVLTSVEIVIVLEAIMEAKPAIKRSMDTGLDGRGIKVDREGQERLLGEVRALEKRLNDKLSELLNVTI